MDDIVVQIHRFAGYPLAFVIAPLALATFAGAPRHRWVGTAYAVVMTYLYITGTVLTLTRHPWASWEFGRNVAFNFFGYSLLLYGFRSIWLFNRPDAPRPTRLDRALRAALIATVAAMTALALIRNTPLKVFALLGIVLVVLELRDWREGFTPAALFRRHVRYILGSYFYVLTVASVVHFKDEMSPNARWLWPSLLGVIVIALAHGSAVPGIAARRGTVARWAIGATIAAALVFGTYAGWEVMRDLTISRAPASAASP